MREKLENIIEELKEGFFLMRESHKWVAGKMHSGIDNRGFGKTCKEAVINLRLKLKENKNEY